MRANDLISFRHHKADDPGLTAIWEDRKDAIEQIRVLVPTFCFSLLRDPSRHHLKANMHIRLLLQLNPFSRMEVLT